VASLTEAQLADLTSDTRIIRNRKKVEAIVDNARRMIDLDEQHKGFRKYLRSHGGFEGTVADLRKQFRFLGETGCYYFLWVVKEEVPDYDTWCGSRGIVHATAHVN
jgi:Methyladenine glycosylase